MTPEDLKKRDFILLIDRSASMQETDCPGGKSRWDYAHEVTVGFAQEMVKYDDNGITVIPFNNHFKKYENIQGGDDKTKQIFSEAFPSGSTDTALVLKDVLDEYIATRKSATCKPIIVVCVTDGLPDDEKALVNVIVNASKQIDNEEEIGIEFIQIGKDAHARDFLKRLDDNLTNEGAKFDIVNTTTMDDLADKSMTDVLIAAVTE